MVIPFLEWSVLIFKGDKRMSFIDLSKEETREFVPGLTVRVVEAHNVTLAYWSIKAGTLLSEHCHSQEQVSNVLKGELEITIGHETRILKENSIAVIPSNTIHYGRAITDLKILDVFSKPKHETKENSNEGLEKSSLPQAWRFAA